MKKKLIERKARLLAWAGIPYLDAGSDCQKSEEELEREVKGLERSLAE